MNTGVGVVLHTRNMLGFCCYVLLLVNIASSAKPNIGKCKSYSHMSMLSGSLPPVFILTDDQDVKLNSLDVQPKVKSLLINEGTFFKNAFVTTPVCCPSR